jgi:acetyltransferase-like isoleucine patch superfamily enzyme
MNSPTATLGKPDAPVTGLSRPLRRIIRELRLLRLKVTVRIVYGGQVKVGKDVAIGSRSLVMSRREFVLGDRVRIGPGFTCHVDMLIGSDTLISGSVAIVGKDHPIDTEADVFAAPRNLACRVILDGDNLIGFGAIIVGPCRIGRGAIVGAGSVVCGDLEPETVYAGVPARPLRLRQRG